MGMQRDISEARSKFHN